jgi:neurotransmitter:Na+ symporter, NSS family
MGRRVVRSDVAEARLTEREEWGTRTGFIAAAVGSAIGLGNIWRFPYVAYDNGGGAFIVPYLFALLTAGIPLLVMEYTLGHRYRGSAPLTFRRLNRRTEFIGWWQVAISFVIVSYYAVVLAWAVAYTWFSFGTRWGEDPEGFFFAEFLELADAPGQIGGFVPAVVLPLVLVWGITLGIGFAGVKKGIERATKFMIPLLVSVFLVLVVRAVTLEGAGAGLNALFTPDFAELTNAGVWVAAYGQIFFSLSIAFAIMITYSSYLPRRSDLTNNAFIAGFANSSFELLAGIGVFAAIGFMAVAQGIAVEEVATEGVGLAFVAFPQIINTLPALNSAFGVLFFGSLVLAGLSSLISIVEVLISALRDKFGISRQAAVSVGGGVCALTSLLYATHGGLYVLDSADSFINSFGVAIVGLVEVIAVAWVLRHLRELQRHCNAVSDIAVGAWWLLALGVVTPLVLGYQAFENFRVNIAEPYEGYPLDFLLVTGWGVAAGALVAGVVLSLLRWHPDTLLHAEHTEHDDAAARPLND